MAETLEIGVGHLLPELLADALVLLSPLQAAGAVSAGALQTLADHRHHFLVIVQTNRHGITSFLPYYSHTSPFVKTKKQRSHTNGLIISLCGRLLNNLLLKLKLSIKYAILNKKYGGIFRGFISTQDI